MTSVKLNGGRPLDDLDLRGRRERAHGDVDHVPAALARAEVHQLDIAALPRVALKPLALRLRLARRARDAS